MIEILGYIIIGLITLLYGWALTVWWRFNKWIAIAIPLMFILLLIASVME